jgi:hypothetical protein
MKQGFIIFFLLLSRTLFSQFSDNFSDGNYTENPNWFGQSEKFITSPEQQLRLFLSPQEAGTAFLSTTSESIDNATWEFFARLFFNPSSANFSRIYLVSNNSDLSGPLNGYFVLIGGSSDKISLFRQTGTTSAELIAGIEGTVNLNDVLVNIKVTRDASGNWELLRDIGVSGNYISEGVAFDNTHIQSTHFGVFCEFTSTRSQHFYFDDFVVTGDPFVDNQAPVFQSLTINGQNQLTLEFNEILAQSSANVANFNVNNGLGNPETALINPLNPAQVILNFEDNFTDNTNYVLSASNISDPTGNEVSNFDEPFYYFELSIPQFGEIRINEVMADESPSMGQPPVEYVELFNTTNKTFDLTGYKICNDNSCGTIQTTTLAPNGYLVVTPTSGLGLFPNANSINATSFPGLKNDGDDVILKNPTESEIVDFMSYDLNTYQDPASSDGGYSFELINPFNPCLGANNWRANNSQVGGTPGQLNSVFDNSPDTTPPSVISAFLTSPNALEIRFNERMEIDELLNLDFAVNFSGDIQNVLVEGAFSDQVVLEFEDNFQVNTIYAYSINNLTDCSGNVATLNGTFVLTDQAEIGDIVVNEILSNPVTGGVDYIELFNNSDKYINLKNWNMASLSNGIPANFRIISINNFIFIPKSYLVLTVDSNQVKQTYVNHGYGRFVYCNLPTYANSDGNVLLMNELNTVVDSVSYTEKWHFQLLEDEKGKSLERINPNGSSNEAGNWQTASETVGWGTPGLQNSQYLNPQALGQFNIVPGVISPDNDGFEDFAVLLYELPENGMTGTIKIYDENGRPVRELVNNFFLDLSGELKWDGLNDSGFKCRIGRYIVVFEVFSAQTGTSISFKKAVVIAGKD